MRKKRTIWKAGVFVMMAVGYFAAVCPAEVLEDGHSKSTDIVVVESFSSQPIRVAGTVVLDFEDLPLAIMGRIPSGYAGLEWDCYDEGDPIWWDWKSEPTDPDYSEPHSGINYVFNAFGVSNLGFSLPGPADCLSGAWFANTTAVATPERVRFNGYNASSVLVEQSAWLTISSTPQYLAANFGPVARIEVEHSTSGEAWYTMDDLTYETGPVYPPVPEPNNPDPCDGATDVPVDTCLSWDGAIRPGVTRVDSEQLLARTFEVVPGQIDATTGQIFETAVQTTLHKDLAPKKPFAAVCEKAVLWDLTHGVHLDYQPAGRFSSLVSILESKGFSVSTTTAGVDNIDLSVYDVLVVCLGSAWNSAYTASEVSAIQTFVNNGGGLLVMGENTDCPNSNINPVAQAFGVTCGVSYLSPLDLYFSDFAAHLIFAGCSELYDRAAGELGAVSPGELVAWTDSGLGTVAITSGGARIVVTGDNNFGDNAYIHISDNQLFSENLFDWLAQVDGTTWDLYFGTDPCALDLIASDLDEPNCCIGELECETRYFWQVVAKNCRGETQGPVWSFTTELYNQEPNCSNAVASISEVWPPNHKWQAIEILGVEDPDGDPVSITITRITQDERLVGNGSGNTIPDGAGIGRRRAYVRAERSGQGNGRVYEIHFEADDGMGGVCNGTVSVCVPHDKGKDGGCVDDGQFYNSTALQLIQADFNDDGTVDQHDFAIFSAYWLDSYELDEAPEDEE